MCEAEGDLKWCWTYFSMSAEGKQDQLTPLPLSEVRVRCWVIEVSAEHGFCTRVEVVREHQR